MATIVHLGKRGPISVGAATIAPLAAFGEPASDDHCVVLMAYEGWPDLREELERRGWRVQR